MQRTRDTGTGQGDVHVQTLWVQTLRERTSQGRNSLGWILQGRALQVQTLQVQTLQGRNGHTADRDEMRGMRSTGGIPLVHSCTRCGADESETRRGTARDGNTKAQKH